jgi:hypothetical protein
VGVSYCIALTCGCGAGGGQELEEQVRDLMVFIETQGKLADGTSELAHGSVVSVSPSPEAVNRASLRGKARAVGLASRSPTS